MLTTAAVICGALVAAGCAGSAAKPTTHYGATAPTTGAQIQFARSSSPLFSIFPAAPGTKACVIPAGVVGLHGTCRTSVRPARTHESAFIVTFTESWMSGGRCPPGGYCPVSWPLHHTWTIVEGTPVSTPGARLHILARRESGVPAPQFND